MSDHVFGQVYAGQYDLLYNDKDYEAECDFLEAIFRKFDLPVSTILDLGCGTGGHAIPLVQRGYHVTGVDRSEAMLVIGQENAEEMGVEVEFALGDIRTVDLGHTYDAVISMFAVMCYQSTNDDLAAACRTARRHLNPGGIFVFDGWHGPGVLTDRPTHRIKIVEDGDHCILRFTEPAIDVKAHTVETRFRMWVVENDQVLYEADESHFMRYLFPQEIDYFLTVAGFKDVEFCPFLRLEEEINDFCWNFAVMARAT